MKEATIRQVVADYLKERSAGLGCEIEVRKIGYSGDLALPAGVVAYEVVAPQQWEGWGAAGLALLVRVDDRLVKNIPIRVDVEALADVVVATRALERGEVISQGDVALQKRDLSIVGGKVCRSINEVTGKQVRVPMRATSPVRNDYIEKVPLVRSGQIVTMIAKNRTLEVTATGRAKSAGAMGDTVVVQNLTSQRELAGRVVDSSTVEIDF